MRRFRDPAILAFAIALIASLGLHVPAYEVLGVLAERLLDREPVARGPTEVEFTVGEASEPESEGEPARDERAGEESTEASETEQPRATESPSRPEPKTKKPEEKDEPEDEAEQETELEARKAQADPAHKLSVKQHSRDPDVDRPDDARFLARENNRVEQETVARIRNDVRDDAEPHPGETREGSEPEPGSSDETDVAQLREMEGSDVRTPTPEEATEDRPEEAPDVDPRPVPSGSAEGPERAGKDPGGSGEAESSDSARERTAEQRGQEAAPQGKEGPIIVEDGFGTLRVPRSRAGLTESTGGEGDASSTREQRQARRARPGRQGSGGDRGQLGPSGPDQRFAWSDLEEMYGREQLEEERKAYVRERKSKRRGSNRKKRWKEFRSAIENFVPNVQPGNQTALNAAASPFAEYISDVHRRLHREFADKFLAGLPTFSSSPFADRSLRTKLEIILNRDGSVHRVGVVESSGFLPFDYGAFASVMRAQPYPESPHAVRSGDGRVYFHWGFYRNARQCGTFNAEPFILPNPPGTPGPSKGPLQDEPEWGGVVPEGSEPSWGTEEEGEGDGDSSGEGSGGGDESAPSDDGEGGDEPRRPDGERPPRRPDGRGSAMG